MTPDQLKGFIQGARSIASELKRAPMPERPPLYESTRAFQAEQDIRDGMPRGVQAGETIEEARQRYAAEDQRDYIPPITEDQDFDEVDQELYEQYPEMRDIILEDRMREEQRREPQSMQMEPIDIQGDYEGAAMRGDMDSEQDVDELMQDIENLPTPPKPTEEPEMSDEYRQRIARAFQQTPEDKRARQAQDSADMRADEQSQARLTDQMMKRSREQYKPTGGSGFDQLMEQAQRVIPRSRQARR